MSDKATPKAKNQIVFLLAGTIFILVMQKS